MRNAFAKQIPPGMFLSRNSRLQPPSGLHANNIFSSQLFFTRTLHIATAWGQATQAQDDLARNMRNGDVPVRASARVVGGAAACAAWRGRTS